MRALQRYGLVAMLALLLPSVAQADPRDDARRHFMAGLEAARAQQYEVALQHFLSAQEHFPHPATLYNIARTYQDLGDLQNALSYYRLFRDADPTRRAEVDPVVAVLEARLGQQQMQPTLPDATRTRTVAAQGPAISPELMARMQALAAEFEALTVALAEAQVEVEAVADVEDDEFEGDEFGDLELPDLPGGGFLEDAYQRVVVTASRYGQEPLDSPSTVTILTDEDIRMMPVTSLPDLLRRVVGVEAMSPSAGHTDISIRGFNREVNNKILVLIDGRSTYYDFIGATMWETLPLALEEIERVEVIRGPGSAVYGANAVTGVVNIITRVPGEGQNLARLDYGAPGYARGTVFATGRTGQTGWRFSTNYVQHGRWAKEYDPSIHTSLDYALEDQDKALDSIRLNGRVDHQAGEVFASLSGGLARGANEFYNIGALGNYYIDINHHYLRGDVAVGPVHFRAFWNADTGQTGPWAQPVGTPRDLTAGLRTNVVDLELEGSHDFDTGNIHHRLNAGIGYRMKHTEFGYIGLVREEWGDGVVYEHHQNAFLQAESTIDRTKLVASLRVDRHPLLQLSETISPRLSAIYRIFDQTSLRVTGGTAIRAPNMVESYMDFNLNTTADGVFIADYGDPNLSPERILTAEIGLYDESTLYHRADVTVYVNRLTDTIFLRPVERDLQMYDPEARGYRAGHTGWANLDNEYLGYGVEADLKLFPVDGLDVIANVALQRIFEISGDDWQPDLSTATLKLNGGVMYRARFRTDFSAGVHYVGPQTWGLRSFDATGALVSTPEAVPARAIGWGRVGFRPFSQNDVEIAANIWNVAGLADVGRVREHPQGQPIATRAFGTLIYRF